MSDLQKKTGKMETEKVQENSLDKITAAQMEKILDYAPMGVIVSEADSQIILYANRKLKEMFPLAAREGITCYQAAGFDAPCSLCCIKTMREEEAKTRRFTHPDNNRIYELHGRVIDWAGKRAHIEYIADVTQNEQEKTHSEWMQSELEEANKKISNIINVIPGGVAIYKVSDILQNVYFSDGMPAISGYTPEECRRVAQRDSADMIYREDYDMVMKKVKEVIRTQQSAVFEFRMRHKDGHIVWVSVSVTWIGEEDGKPLLHCVFFNITEQKLAQMEMNHLVNSLPGGIASYRIMGSKFIPDYYSDGVSALSGHTKEEFAEIIKEDALNIVYEADKERVIVAAKQAVEKGEVLDISYRVRHKEGNLVWIHLNGRRMEPLTEGVRFYAVFSGISAETRLFQGIMNETADFIYIIDKESYELLYRNVSKGSSRENEAVTGQKCYEILRGKTKPCEFCPLQIYAPDGKPHEMEIEETKQFYRTSFRETDWNGIPAYVKYDDDITEEKNAQLQRALLERYFQNILKYLPGGVAVIRYDSEGRAIPEFLSEGFADMTDMTLEETWRLYEKDAMIGVHPDDRERIQKELEAYMVSGRKFIEFIYRLKKGNGGYLWVKNRITMIQSDGGERRVYADYHDITKELDERETLRSQYNELLMQHYRMHGPNTLIVGHCDITANRILEIIDYTDSDLLQVFGTVREEFFTGVSSLVVDTAQKKTFLEIFLNAPAMSAYERGCFEVIQNCFIKLPKEEQGRYAEFKVNFAEAPDTGHVTGILTVTDTTEQTITERILQRLSVVSYDRVVDMDIKRDRCTIIAGEIEGKVQGRYWKYSEHVKGLLERVLPKDKNHVAEMLSADTIATRLQQKPTYSFSYSLTDKNKIICTKKVTVFASDLKLGRICLATTDITDSVKEQQKLLNVIAYTFEILSFVDVASENMTLYTRQMVIENLPPFEVKNYDDSLERIEGFCDSNKETKEIRQQFCLSNLRENLREKPFGYDFLQPYWTEEGMRYKKVSVMWGDMDRKTVCMVRDDVTEMLETEYRAKSALEEALQSAKRANQAKSDFLASMSHDIRTPMNAIMGMTALATAYISDSRRVEDYLKKINLSSKHLLSLINDILDMNKIESSKLTFNPVEMFLNDFVEQLSSMMMSQAKEAGVDFEIRMKDIKHPYFYGDALRINQVLINILGNAFKYTPEGGKVTFDIEETESSGYDDQVCYRFIICDTGVGMSEDFQQHLFEPFIRSSNAARIEGSGLGLSITKGLVDLMKGKISVQSEELKGSAFTVELGFSIAPGVSGKTAAGMETEWFTPETEEVLKDKCFLVAEDNPINAEILFEILKMCGAECIIRTDGRQTIQTFQSAKPHTYDAVLMDIQMPEMNGYEAARAIRAMERPDAGTIPIIAMTANAFIEDIQAALEAGMDAHIAKPIDLKLLQTTLKRILGRKK